MYMSGKEMPAPEQFSAENVEPYRFDSAERHSTALREADEVITMDGPNGQSFSGLHLNRDFSEGPVIVRVGSMNSSSTTGAQKYTSYQYAAAFPESPVITIDLPSHGYSDRHTVAQRTERIIKKSGSRTAAAEAEAVAAYMDSSSEYIVSGDSFGAQLVPDFAIKLGELGVSPRLIFGFDMTGVNYFNTRQTFVKMNKARKAGHSAYHRGAANERLDEAFDAFCEELDQFGENERVYNPFHVGKRDPVFTLLSVLRSATNGEAGMDALERSMELNDQMVAAMVSGGLSRICDWRKIEPRVDGLKQKFGDRFTWEVWPNDSHSMSIAPQQPRSIAFAKAVIDAHITAPEDVKL
jgi:hypothetical protein